QELGDRAWVAVGDQQRLGAGPAGLDVQEVDALAVDLGGELRAGVEPRLGSAPVVPCAPIPGELRQVAQRDAALPPHFGQRAWPADAGQPLLQVFDVGLGDVDPKRLDGLAHRRCSLSASSCACAARLETIAESFFPRLSAGSRNAGNLGTAVAPAVAVAG